MVRGYCMGQCSFKAKQASSICLYFPRKPFSYGDHPLLIPTFLSPGEVFLGAAQSFFVMKMYWAKLLSWLFSSVLSRTGVGKFFQQGPNSQYFQLCRPDGLCGNYWTLPLKLGSSLGWYVNEWVWPRVNKALFIKTGRGPDLPHRLWFADPCSRIYEPKCYSSWCIWNLVM